MEATAPTVQVNQVLEAIQGVLSVHTPSRNLAEGQLRTWETESAPGFLSCLLQIAEQVGLVEEVRATAAMGPSRGVPADVRCAVSPTHSSSCCISAAHARPTEHRYRRAWGGAGMHKERACGHRHHPAVRVLTATCAQSRVRTTPRSSLAVACCFVPCSPSACLRSSSPRMSWAAPGARRLAAESGAVCPQKRSKQCAWQL